MDIVFEIGDIGNFYLGRESVAVGDGYLPIKCEPGNMVIDFEIVLFATSKIGKQ